LLTFIFLSNKVLVGWKMPLSERIVKEVAREEDAAPNELEPLYDAVNPDALNQLFKSQQHSGMVVFPYMGYEVFVTSDGKIKIE